MELKKISVLFYLYSSYHSLDLFENQALILHCTLSFIVLSKPLYSIVLLDLTNLAFYNFAKSLFFQQFILKFLDYIINICFITALSLYSLSFLLLYWVILKFSTSNIFEIPKFILNTNCCQESLIS